MTINLSDQEVYDLIQYMNKIDNNPAFLQEELNAYANEKLNNRNCLHHSDLFAGDVL